jgi:hypothetical protein
VQLEAVELLERPGIEQQLDALACGELPEAVLALDAIGAAAELGPRVELVEPLEPLLERQGQYSFCACSTVMAVRFTRSSTDAVGWM